MILLQEIGLTPEDTRVRDRMVVALSEMHASKTFTERKELEDFLDSVIAEMPADMPKGLTRIVAFITDTWAYEVVMARMAFGFTATFYTQPDCWKLLRSKLPELEVFAAKFSPPVKG